MEKTAGYLAGLLFAAALTGCSEDGSEAVSEAEPIKSSAEMVTSFESTEEMQTEADVIVEGEVQAQEVVVHGDLPFTISEIAVMEGFKGEFKAGDTIRVLETGGTYQPEGKDGEALPETDFALSSAGVMETGEQFFLFLRPFTGPQTEGAFIPLGAYQGKFLIEGQEVRSQENGEALLEQTAAAFREMLK
ncbi:hypothetical protein [Planococcus lenghuensis]|uniref:Lipoprotein n=1 Tax=Planococcus lenghuensis TaxID=2213202 RepID=A0A1Q2KZ69_9BACL|nr:hypothetical protein [Planococcus lenghuensis]AQQ53097.1 hypothetical protein B0X71_08315 [Planococcus lenghuensis]